MWREHVQTLAMFVNHSRILHRIGLDPVGNVMHSSVLPRAEPEQDEVHAVGARLLYQFIHNRKIEAAGPRLQLLPVDRCFDCVRMDGLNRRPNLGQHRRPGARVVDLRTQNEERLAIDQQRVAVVFFDEPWHFGAVSSRHITIESDSKKGS